MTNIYKGKLLLNNINGINFMIDLFCYEYGFLSNKILFSVSSNEKIIKFRTENDNFNKEIFNMFDNLFWKKIIMGTNSDIKKINNMHNITNKETLDMLNNKTNSFKLNSYFNNYNYNISLITKYMSFIKNNILFEIITTDSGDKYGKEVISGLLFPILDSDNLKIDNNNVYKIINEPISENSSVLGLVPHTTTTYQLKLKYNLELRYNNLSKINVLISPDCSLASKKEIDEYKNNLNNKFKKKKFINTINNYYNQNMIIEEIIPSQNIEKELEKQNNITIIMEDIEYKLLLLKQKNMESYNKLYFEYNELINQNDKLTVRPLNINSLKSLEAKIEFELSFNKNNNSNIMDYLNNLKDNYIQNMIIGNKTDISIKDLDKLSELFLKSKDDYTLINQRDIIKNISMLYLFEIYENIDSIRDDDLNKGYFKNYLKTILIIINSFIELDLVDNNIYIDFNDVSINNILNIVRSLKFKNFSDDNNKMLIRKI